MRSENWQQTVADKRLAVDGDDLTMVGRARALLTDTIPEDGIKTWNPLSLLNKNVR